MSSTDAPSERDHPSEPFDLLRGGRIYQRLLLDPMRESPGRLPVWRALLFAGLAWLPLAILSLVSGTFLTANADELAFGRDLTVHVRLLLALPVLLLIEPMVRARLELAVHYLDRSDVIPKDDMPRWHAAVESARRRRDSVVWEVLLIATAFAVSLWGTFGLAAARAGGETNIWRWQSGGDPSLAGWWYALVTAPIVVYHVLRWLYRIGLWTLLLRTLSRLRLQLRPGHPDLCGGLGILSICQTSFAPFFSAIAIMSSGSLAYEILREGHSVFEYKLLVSVFVLASLLLMYGPLFLFARASLWARERVFSQYAATANLMFNEYEGRWIAGVWKGDPEGNMDPSAMTDYSQVFENIRRMRVVPIEPRLLLAAAGMIFLPFLPLIFTAMSLQELLQRIAKAVL